MTGRIRWAVIAPAPNNAAPATWGLWDHNDEPVDISASATCGLQEAIDLMVASGYPLYGCGGPATGGPAPAGTNVSMAFLDAPVTVPPVIYGTVKLDGLSLIAQHSGAAVLQLDSMMATSWEHRGGQIVLSETAENQIGLWVNPRSPLPIDGHGPCSTTSDFWLPSIVGERGIGQILAKFDGGDGTIGQVKATFIEPNGGDYGIVAVYGAHGYGGLTLDIVGAHQSLNSLVNLGWDAPVPAGSILRGTLASGPWGPSSQILDTWETNGIYDIIADYEDAPPPRCMTFEKGSLGCQVRLGGALAGMAPICAPGSGPNYVNGKACCG